MERHAAKPRHHQQVVGTTTCNEKKEEIMMRPRMFVLLENPKQTTNWGPILRCCAAFGIPQIFAVGYDKCGVQGSHGSHKHVEISAFPTHEQAKVFLRETCQVSQFLGLINGSSNSYNEEGYPTEVREVTTINQQTKVRKSEICLYIQSDTNNATAETAKRIQYPRKREYPKSLPVSAKPFQITSNCCLVIGRRSQGLPIALADICDSFIHVPLAAEFDDGNDSLNMLDLESCMSIVLHTFYLHAKISMDEGRGPVGQKYQVEKAQRGSMENQEKERKERLAKRQQLAEEAMKETTAKINSDLFDDGDY
jgi:tRNA(Leu) C34 or U34 (ribose-2'-O)-methylase TrmL